MSYDDLKQINLTGIGASPGICIGKAYLVDREGVDVIQKYFLDENETKEEVNRLRSAVQKAKQELVDIIAKIPEELQQHASILETHILLLEDKLLLGKAVEAIEKQKVNAEWALKTVVGQLKTMFHSVQDAYLKQRTADITHVSDRIMCNLVGAKPRNIGAIEKRVVLVANDLSPAETSQIQLARVKGFVTDLGGKASHTAIIARTLEIPAVLGLENATSLIGNEDFIIVDGNRGEVIIHPTEATLLKFEERQIEHERYKAVITRQSHLPACTLDGMQLKVMGNIELPEEVVSVMDHGGDGIGLYRTEFQYLNRPTFPEEFELYDKYKDVAEVIHPRTVTIRTLDINGDKALTRRGEADEANPALGLRGIRYCLEKTDVFKTQLRAILRAATCGNIRLMFPMISHYEEIVRAKRIMAEVAEDLARENIAFKSDIPVGILIEVPSAVITAEMLAEEVDFFSIGTNDLIQYSLAIDRGNRQVAHLYQPLDPAIIRMVQRTARVAHDKGIEVYMCGEMAGEHIFTPILLALGLDELSMNPQAIPAVKAMVRSLSSADLDGFIKEIMIQKTARDISRITKANFGTLLESYVRQH